MKVLFTEVPYSEISCGVRLRRLASLCVWTGALGTWQIFHLLSLHERKSNSPQFIFSTITLRYYDTPRMFRDFRKVEKHSSSNGGRGPTVLDKTHDDTSRAFSLLASISCDNKKMHSPASLTNAGECTSTKT